MSSSELLSIGLLLLVVALSMTDGWTRRRSRSAPGARDRSPSLYELAYLAGGVRRVVVTALAVLARAKAVRLSGDGHVEAGPAAVGEDDAIAAGVVAAVKSRGGRVSVAELPGELADSEAIAALSGRLIRQRLLLPPGHQPPRWSRRLLTVSIWLAVVAVVILAFAREPLGAVIAAVGVVIGEVARRRAVEDESVPLTDAGHHVLTHAFTRHEEGGLRGMPDAAVALLGGSGALNHETRHGLQTVETAPLDEGSWVWKPKRFPGADPGGGSGLSDTSMSWGS
ncbi:hypothetical protein Pth03_69840 [Planotetraspora thailandica]|uniref:TIGR04222 domain-containing membrane protein n=1 Tax=Planotetraspora thailandica TaxID=487172 RepID=A0A8J3Y0J1_9ACTN|nr:TIGR04222 domain-containing membrane protein [Planotetraspora thailandica]GII58595.1 hypothetical protein Pth03_69840 [Planotetraspora thailandica]